jgi:hypothetical protein
LLGFSEKVGNATSIGSILFSILKDDGGYEEGMTRNIINTYLI